MKVAIFSTKDYDRKFLDIANAGSINKLTYFEPRLSNDTVRLITDQSAVCVFVNDELNAEILAALKQAGIALIALRCAGFNNVDLKAAAQHGIAVAHVPTYSPRCCRAHRGNDAHPHPQNPPGL
ncbi:hypothetical protein [Parasphingorhabdus sp.]|uniref:hypothetical protein n=1 Tax=Parasphingorhabdus sp. TaxID=2709688 RepID=UPI003BB12D3B